MTSPPISPPHIEESKTIPRQPQAAALAARESFSCSGTRRFSGRDPQSSWVCFHLTDRQAFERLPTYVRLSAWVQRGRKGLALRKLEDAQLCKPSMERMLDARRKLTFGDSASGARDSGTARRMRVRKAGPLGYSAAKAALIHLSRCADPYRDHRAEIVKKLPLALPALSRAVVSG
jgi:hypothetical protein